MAPRQNNGTVARGQAARRQERAELDQRGDVGQLHVHRGLVTGHDRSDHLHQSVE